MAHELPGGMTAPLRERGTGVLAVAQLPNTCERYKQRIGGDEGVIAPIRLTSPALVTVRAQWPVHSLTWIGHSLYTRTHP